MPTGYEINELDREQSWRMFRIIGEFVEGFDKLAGVEPAISIYGSARVLPEDKLYLETEEIARRLGEMGFSIITGGGPGVMEAANRGASEAGVKSFGLHIELPDEQACNVYATKSIRFNHFFARKVMLVKYATAFVIIPGGVGTLDELTEILVLMQTHKIKPFPIVLFDSEFWKGFLHWLKNTVLARKFISEDDLDLLRICDRPDEVINMIQKWYQKQEVTGRKALVEED